MHVAFDHWIADHNLCFLVLVGLAFAMWIVGKFSKGIKEGAIGLALTGLAIVVLAYAIKKFHKALPPNPWEFFAQLGVALVGLGVIKSAKSANSGLFSHCLSYK